MSEASLAARIARKDRLKAAIDAIERRVQAEFCIDDPDEFEVLLLAQGFRIVDMGGGQ